MFCTQSLPTVLFVFLTMGDTAPLVFDVSESPCAEARYVSQLGSNGRTRAREIETVHEDRVNAFEWQVFDLPPCQIISGMKTIIEVTTSGSVDVTNRRAIHLTSSPSTSLTRKIWNFGTIEKKRGLQGT